MADSSLCYIGTCKECGACRAAIVAEGVEVPKWNREVARFCAGVIRDGLKLETRTAAEVRAADWNCQQSGGLECSRGKKKKVAHHQESLAL